MRGVGRGSTQYLNLRTPLRHDSREPLTSSEGTERFVVLNNAVEDLLELLLKSNKRHSSNTCKKGVFVSSILSTVLVSRSKKLDFSVL